MEKENKPAEPVKTEEPKPAEPVKTEEPKPAEPEKKVTELQPKKEETKKESSLTV